MPAAESLAHYLASLDEHAFADVLRRRPDALAVPWPSHFSDVVMRLGSAGSIVTALRRQQLPNLETLGAITLQRMLEEPPTIENTAHWLGTDTVTVTGILDDLATAALAWPDGRGSIATFDDFPPLSAPVGYPVRDHVETMTMADLQPLSKMLRLRVEGRKFELVDRVVGFFRDADAVRALVETAPPDERALLDEVAEKGAALEYYRSGMYGRGHDPRRGRSARPGDWAVARGLLVPDDYSGTAVMPLEVTLALRGERWRLPFHPVRPQPATTPVSGEHVDTDAAAHLLRMIERISALADRAEGELIPLLKSGTVGVRTVRALAKDWGVDTDEVAVALDTAIDIGVLTPAEPPAPARSRGRKAPPPTASPGLELGPAATAWRSADTPVRGATVLRRWWESYTLSLADRTLVTELGSTSVFGHVRNELVRTYGELPVGSAATLGEITPLVTWRMPFVEVELLVDLIAPTLREAELLGVVALGAPSPLAGALLAGDLDDAVAALVADAHTKALFGADLTAVVFGPPTTDLSRLLDTVADRESRGTATTWRFTAASIRAALDQGASAAEIRDRLTAVAQSGLPQALDYLITDVARTHGKIGVVELGCAVVADDPTLLVELSRSRAGVKLGLAPLAPTVLASRVDAVTTLDVLRTAGYAPVLRDGDGAVRIERSTEPSSGGGEFVLGAEPGRVPAADPAFHARHLLQTVGEEPQLRDRHGFFRALRGHGGIEAIALLAEGEPVTITEGDRTALFHSAVLCGNTLTAWNVNAERYEELRTADIIVAVP